MKSRSPGKPGKKAMRVATALTGVAACAAGFLPAAAAQAATPGGQPAKIKPKNVKWLVQRMADGSAVATPDNTAPTQPYWLDINFKNSVRSFQACGWHPGNVYRCTPWQRPTASHLGFHVGGNLHSWDRGQITIGWNGGAAGHRDTCNTNGAYYGLILSGQSGFDSVVLTSPNFGGIGDGVPTC